MERGIEPEKCSFIAEEKIRAVGKSIKSGNDAFPTDSCPFGGFSELFFFLLPVQALNFTMSALPTVPRSSCNSERS